MKLATWNVNSIRVRIDAVCDWVKRVEPDVLCLQETKVVDDDFPSEELQYLGYALAIAGQNTYNGVAIASRLPMKNVRTDFSAAGFGPDKRLIAATIGGVQIFSAYVPNGQAVGSPAFATKLSWLASLRNCLQRLRGEPLAVCGDFNIAADARDVYDLDLFQGKLFFHPDEHRALVELSALGLRDAFRKFHEEGGQYSWWDYRGSSLRKNEGLRIDYVFLNELLLPRCTSAWMDPEPRRLDKPSDHIPVVVEIAD